jgi:hypothetical protein
VVLLAGLHLSIGGALLLFGLFFGQFVLPVVVEAAPGIVFGLKVDQIHPVFSFLYLAAAAAIILQRPARIARLLRPRQPFAPPPSELLSNEEDFHTPHCRTCKWRMAAQSEKLVNSKN